MVGPVQWPASSYKFAGLASPARFSMHVRPTVNKHIRMISWWYNYKYTGYSTSRHDLFQDLLGLGAANWNIILDFADSDSNFSDFGIIFYIMIPKTPISIFPDFFFWKSKLTRDHVYSQHVNQLVSFQYTINSPFFNAKPIT